jgi:hypothetical protein
MYTIKYARRTLESILEMEEIHYWDEFENLLSDLELSEDDYDNVADEVIIDFRNSSLFIIKQEQIRRLIIILYKSGLVIDSVEE